MACPQGWKEGIGIMALSAHTVRVAPDGTAVEHYLCPGQTWVCPGSGQPVREPHWIKRVPDDVP